MAPWRGTWVLTSSGPSGSRRRPPFGVGKAEIDGNRWKRGRFGARNEHSSRGQGLERNVRGEKPRPGALSPCFLLVFKLGGSETEAIQVGQGRIPRNKLAMSPFVSSIITKVCLKHNKIHYSMCILLIHNCDSICHVIKVKR